MRHLIGKLLVLAIVSTTLGIVIGGLGTSSLPVALAGEGDPGICVDADPWCAECSPCLDGKGEPTGEIECTKRAGWIPATGVCCMAVIGYIPCHIPN